MLLALNPGAFSMTSPDFPANQLLYFSFITMMTVGYGDIVPLTPIARNLAVLEAFVGQLYLAIFVGRLVGMHLSASKEQG
jgi:voltage-gated potassium channel